MRYGMQTLSALRQPEAVNRTRGEESMHARPGFRERSQVAENEQFRALASTPAYPIGSRTRFQS